MARLPYRRKSPDEVRRNMSAIRSTENRTEAEFRSALHRAGLRFRKYALDLPGKPDIVFRSARVAVFVDGDFWHARIVREEGLRALRRRIPRQRQEYWVEKFRRRVQRDDEVTALLRSDGWTVLRFWESELKADLQLAVRKVIRAVRSRTRPGD